MSVLIRFLFALTLGLPLLFGQTVDLGGPTVRFNTTVGEFDVVLASNYAPLTVANFLNYVNRGAYNGTLFHRLVPGFVAQTGGFTWANNAPARTASDPAVRNEFRISNTRGTLAMAKFGGDANSATIEFFFNLADNSGNLNNQNGGFTVFGWIPNTGTGRDVMDLIAAVPVPTPHPFAGVLDGALETAPLRNYTSGSVQEGNLVRINSITVLDGPSIASDGILTASAFGGYRTAAPGSFIEIYGANFGSNTRGWGSNDFSSGNAPTRLANTSVTVNGVPAFVQFVSPTQINVQIPESVPSSGTVPVIINRGGALTSSFNLNMRPLAPGLLAPANFRINNRQYVAAIRPNQQFTGNGNIDGITTSPAERGETLVIYGGGFGPVSPDGTRYAGVVPTGQSQIRASVAITIGGQPATVTYAGLAPGLVGIYQFNVVVPANAATGDQPLLVTVDGEPIGQTLFLPIR